MSIRGLTETQRRMQSFGSAERTTRAAGRGLFRLGEEIMALSASVYCPVARGTLRASKYVRPPDVSGSEVGVELGYGGPAAPYALKVHENPRTGRTGGRSPSGRPYRRYSRVGQWKYLTTPFQQLKGKASTYIAQEIGAF